LKKRTLIIDVCWKENSLSKNEFVGPVVKNFSGAKVVHFSKLKYSDVQKADRIMICGTALKDNIVLNHLEKFNWIREEEKPILGICSGAYLIALAFGCKLKRCLEIGAVEMRKTAEDKLLENLPKRFEGFCLHNFAVELSKEFKALAKSKKCVEAFRHKTKPIYGFLFHPEVRLDEIFKSFRLV